MKKILILGNMNELGDILMMMHLGLLNYIDKFFLNLLFCVANSLKDL